MTDNRMKAYLIVGIILFYIGDIYTTYINLRVGNIETNTILKRLNFGVFIILKTLFVLCVLWIYSSYKGENERQLEIGVILGALLAIGFYTFFNNIGVFIATR